MSKIDLYFSSLEKRLRDDFTRRRAMIRDSDVKGGANERAVGEFLQTHLQPSRVVYNKQIIDPHGMYSDEVDISSCNFDQPAPDTDLIIAEGVDFAVQVKAILTDEELDRIASNAERVKRLTRRHGVGDVVHTRREDIPYLVDRVPYYVLAFESRLTLKSILERCAQKFNRQIPEHRPDGIFVLERGAVLNVRHPCAQLQAVEFGGRTLMNLLQQLHTVSRGIRRLTSPLLYYFPHDIPYQGHAIGRESGVAATGDFLGKWLFDELSGSCQILKNNDHFTASLGEGGFDTLRNIEALAPRRASGCSLSSIRR